MKKGGKRQAACKLHASKQKHARWSCGEVIALDLLRPTPDLKKDPSIRVLVRPCASESVQSDKARRARIFGESTKEILFIIFSIVTVDGSF